MKLLKYAFALALVILTPLAGFSADSEATKAFKESLKKAQAGDPEAQCEIAKIYIDGNTSFGIKSDRKLAKSWFQKAANQGHESAYQLLSKFHAMGALFYQAYGLNQSDEIAESVKWDLVYRDKETYPSLEWMHGKMSQTTKAEGERRAKAFRDEQAKRDKSPAGK